MLTKPVSSLAGATPPAPSQARWRDPILLVLAVLAVIISIHINRGEFHFTGDEMRHAVSGAFFRDALVDHPISNPMRYVRQYYAKYPALGIPHWPPLFYFVEGLFFLVLGLSVWASRLCVLCYALLGAYFWYRIALRFGPPHLALLSALLYPLMPFMLVFERATMLEVPGFALCLAAIHFWLSYLETDRPRDIWLVAAFSAAAFLTSQKALFLPVFLAVHFLIVRPWRVLGRVNLWLAAAASAAAVVPWYLFSFGALTLSYERVVGSGTSRHWLRQFLYYPQRLHAQLPIAWVILALSGLVWALIRRPRRSWFFLLWVGVAYLCFSLIQEKDVRHTLICIPPLVYFGLLLVEPMTPSFRWRRIGYAAVAAYTVVLALQSDRPRLWGLESVARYVLQQPESDIIYYQGFLNGDFIFFVRKYDSDKSHMVAREKQVVATKIVPGYGTREILTSRDAVIGFFSSWGIRYAVIEDTVFMEGLAPVSAALRSDAFELMGSFPIDSNIAEDRGRKVLVYRYRGPLMRTHHPVTIPMMTIRNDITANLQELAGQPWPRN